MNELSIKLQQSFQHRKHQQKFQEVFTSQNHPSLLPPPKISGIPATAFNTSALPNISHQKINIPTFPKQKSKSMKKLSMHADTSANKIQHKKQTINIDTTKRNNSAHNKRPASSERTISYRLLPRNNLEQKNNKLLQNKFVTPSKQKNQEQVTTGIQGIKIQQQPTTNNIKLQVDTLLEKDKKNKKSTTTKTIKNFDDLLQNINEDIFLSVKDGNIIENGSYKLLCNNFKTSEGIVLDVVRKFIKKYGINKGTIEGKKLLTLGSKKVYSNYQLLCIFTNKKQISTSAKIIGLNFYEPSKSKGTYMAATKIQSLFRMLRDQQYTIKLRSLMKKVIFIQKQWRHSLLIKHTKKDILTNINKKFQRQKNIQKKFIDEWQLIKSSPRVQIHIGAICGEEFKRLTIENIQHCQNTQITRIFRAMETDVSIVYISPITISEEVEKYYERIFSLNSHSYKGKLYILTPENIERLPNHLTLVNQLLYSPKTISRIHKIIALNNSYAYIVPSYPSIEYINLSAELNIPIFSSSPNLLKLYSTKSFCRKIFQQCSLPKLKSIHGIYTEKQLINSLAILFYKHPEIKRWYLKIQDEIRSRGLAIINSENFPFLREVRKQQKIIDENQIEKQIIKLIVDELKVKLRKKLKILNKDVYKNYQQYITHFATRGGIIEAQPINNSQQFSISFQIQPNGDFKIFGTYQKLQLGGKQLPGAILFPAIITQQKQIDLPELTQRTVRALYKGIFLHFKMFGYFTIDLLYVAQENTIYPIGLDCFLNQQTSSLFAGIYCSQSSYNKDTNQLLRKQTIGGGTCQYIYCPMLRMPGIPHLSTFFKKCKFGNISFDIKQKLGFIFMLLDDLECGVLGFFCIEKKKQILFENLQRYTEYLSKQFSMNKGQKKDDLGFLRGISLVWGRKNKKKEINPIINLSSLF